MAHGPPTGFVRLYDERGNAVDLAVRPDGTFGLAVQDDRLRKLVEQVVVKMNEGPDTQRSPSFDSDGNLLVKQAEYDPNIQVRVEDNADHQAAISFMGTLATHNLIRMSGTSFVGTTVDSNFWTSAVSGAGAAIAQVTGKVTLTSGTANSGYSSLQSVRTARFIFAHPMIFRAAVSIPVKNVANNTRLWGVFTGVPPNPTDGYLFQLDADGELNCCYAKGGVLTKIPSGSFNGTLRAYVVDKNVHAYEIHYFLMRVEYYIDGVLVHTVKTSDYTDDLVSQFSLPIQAISKNDAGGTTSGVMYMHAAAVMREGQLETNGIVYHLEGLAATHVLKRGSGRLHRINYNNTSGTSLTIYDSVTGSGTVLAIITTASAALGTWEYSLPFFNGLTLVTVGNSLDATVVYE